jgi:Na+/H+-translocating membrane pyrophosphatase
VLEISSFISSISTISQNQTNKTDFSMSKAMSKALREPATLFRPFLVAGIILVAFGIFCIWIGTSVISLQEEGEGFKIIGTRFLIGGIISIILGFIAKYHLLIKYLIRQFSYKRRPDEDKRSDWYRP